MTLINGKSETQKELKHQSYFGVHNFISFLLFSGERDKEETKTRLTKQPASPQSTAASWQTLWWQKRKTSGAANWLTEWERDGKNPSSLPGYSLLLLGNQRRKAARWTQPVLKMDHFGGNLQTKHFKKYSVKTNQKINLFLHLFNPLTPGESIKHKNL